jgi:hypothetical protein
VGFELRPAAEHCAFLASLRPTIGRTSRAN